MNIKINNLKKEELNKTLVEIMGLLTEFDLRHDDSYEVEIIAKELIKKAAIFGLSLGYNIKKYRFNSFDGSLQTQVADQYSTYRYVYFGDICYRISKGETNKDMAKLLLDTVFSHIFVKHGYKSRLIN